MLYEDDRESSEEPLEDGATQSKRGRKRIPEQYSRVINVYKDDLTRLKSYELAPDLLLSNAMRATSTKSKKKAKW